MYTIGLFLICGECDYFKKVHWLAKSNFWTRTMKSCWQSILLFPRVSIKYEFGTWVPNLSCSAPLKSSFISTPKGHQKFPGHQLHLARSTLLKCWRGTFYAQLPSLQDHTDKSNLKYFLEQIAMALLCQYIQNSPRDNSKISKDLHDTSRIGYLYNFSIRLGPLRRA